MNKKITILITAVVTMFLAGCSQKPTIQNTTLPVANKTYTNSDLGYSIEYPDSWIVEDYSPDALNSDVRIHPANPDLLPVQPTITADYIHIRFESSPLGTARGIASSHVGGNDMVESKIIFAGQDAYFYSHQDYPNPDETVPTVIFRGIILEHNGKVISIYTHKYQLTEVKKALASFKFIDT